MPVVKTEIDEKLLRAVRVKAAKESKTIKEFFHGAIRDALKVPAKEVTVK